MPSIRYLWSMIGACLAGLVLVGASVAAWRDIGVPIPATRDYVDGAVMVVSDNHDDLQQLAIGTRRLVLEIQLASVLERVIILEEKVSSGKASQDTRLLLRTKRREARQLQKQLDRLD